MYNITLISTVHKEMGKCNADELSKILKEMHPEVVFLEALEETYTKYESNLFSSFGVYHKKLEICAIQKCFFNTSVNYVPVLDSGLSDSFEKKYRIVSENVEFQTLLDNFNSLVNEHGFQFLNSNECVRLQEEMRILERNLLNDSDIHKAANDDIDAYENSMIRNIYSYCRGNQFNSAVFLCGNAHRKSIIQKIEKYRVQEEINLNWSTYEN